MTAINSNRAIRGPVTAVPVVAGKGVRLTADTVNNRWVVEADETVLYTGTYTNNTFPNITLSESYTNFEKLEITVGGYYDANYPRPSLTVTLYTADITHDGTIGIVPWSYAKASPTNAYPHFIRYTVSSADTTKLTASNQGMYRQTCDNTPDQAGGRFNTSSAYEYGITRVVGVNRIASN